MHPTRDHHLPIDPEAYRRAPHPRGRVIVIAPTRAACETIELALGLHVDTLLEREHGQELRAWAGEGKAFGIVAGTGTGKTLGIRPIAESILREPLAFGVVNREREATPETPSWNVVVVTTGIARRWFEDELITVRDTLVVDEIHQTSAERNKPLREELRAKRQELRQAQEGGTFNEALATQKLTEMASLEAKLMSERYKIHQETLSVLTAEQKAQLEQSKAQFKTRRGEMRKNDDNQ